MTVEVEGIDVGHGADVVEHTLEFLKECGGVDVILLGKLVEQQLRQQASQAASRFIQELYLKANVVDNRYLFF